MPALYRRVLLIVAKSLVTTIIFFIGAEIALRTAYAVRNTMVRLVPLPYALGDEYGPLPPWLDRLEILVPDEALIWRGVPNARRTYLDIFTPVRSEGDRLALLRRFLPTIPREFRANPTWHVELSSQGFRTSEYALQKPAATLRVAGLPVHAGRASSKPTQRPGLRTAHSAARCAPNETPPTIK